MKGKVTDENTEPIIGATVSVKGSTTGTITDINGQYSIKVPMEVHFGTHTSATVKKAL